MRVKAFSLVAAAVAVGALSGCGAPAGVRADADVILVVVDTLRADALSCYGNPRETSPHLDALFADGVRFEDCLAQAPNTATSHATLFTGLAPWTHRVANLTVGESRTAGLPDAFTTLAERFRDAGYRTAAITDGGPVGSSWNLAQGFDTLEARYEGVERKVDRALRLLDEREDDAPLFLFLHTYQVHLPYLAPDAWADRFDPDYAGPLDAAVAEVRAQRDAGDETQPDGKILLRGRESFTPRDVEHLEALYHGELAWTDHQLERLWARLRETGALERTLICVTSDHGEEFGEHGHYGHNQLFRETLRVPVLVRFPGGGFAAGRVVHEPVSLVDVHDTLLEAADLPAPPVGLGRSLLPLLRGEASLDLPRFAETTEHLYSTERALLFRRAVRARDHALLAEAFEGEADRLRFFDVANDPGERSPLVDGTELPSGPEGDTARSLAAALRTHLEDAERERAERLAGRSASAVVRLDEETQREMDALGYR